MQKGQGKALFSIFPVPPVHRPSPPGHIDLADSIQGVLIDAQRAPLLPSVDQNVSGPVSTGLPTLGRASRIGRQAAVISGLRQVHMDSQHVDLA